MCAGCGASQLGTDPAPPQWHTAPMSVGLVRVVALALLSACTPHAQIEPAAQDAKEQSLPAPDAPPAVAVPPPIVPLPDFVTAPGHLEDGHYYVALRPRQLQEFVRALPIAAKRDEAAAILSAAWGLPLRSIDDLGLEPDALITATLLRPVAPRLAAVRDQIQQLAVAAQAGDPAAIPPLPLELRRDAATMTFHNRLHIPVRDPEILLSIARKQQRAGGLCERLPQGLPRGVPAGVSTLPTPGRHGAEPEDGGSLIWSTRGMVVDETGDYLAQVTAGTEGAAGE